MFFLKIIGPGVIYANFFHSINKNGRQDVTLPLKLA